MNCTRLSKISRSLLVFSLCCTAQLGAIHASEAENLEDPSYGSVYEGWKKQKYEDREQEESLDPSNPDVVDSYGYEHEVSLLSKESNIDYEVEIEHAGLYELDLDYLALSEGMISMQAQLSVNDVVPYDLANRMVFTPLWANESNTFKRDKKGNEVQPSQVFVKKWQNMIWEDRSQKIQGPLKIYLAEGRNTITLHHKSGEVLLGQLHLRNHKEAMDYQEYLTLHKDKVVIQEDLTILEAEQSTSKNTVNITPAVDRSLSVQPYDTNQHLLNMLNITSGNDQVNYEVDVVSSGLYQLAFKVRQDAHKDASVYYQVKIDQEIPFAQANYFAFPQTDGFEVIPFGEEETYLVYLEEGVHTISLNANAGYYHELIVLLQDMNKEVNALGLDIKKIVGNNVDRNRDWDLSIYLPDLAKTLKDMEVRLQDALNDAILKNNGNGDHDAFQKISRSILKLQELSENPNVLAGDLDQLTQGNGSLSLLLADAQEWLSAQPLSLDQIYLYGSADELPSYGGNLIDSMVENGKRFAHSFIGDRETNADEKTLDIWVNRNQNMVDQMQQFADERFSSETGIRVNFSLMPNEQKLILSNTSGKQPDLALGVSTTIPYEFAIRNAALDLRQFEDFNEVSKRFSPGAFLSYSMNDGVYALPETQDFYVTFYRKDILDKLGIPVPDTWDEVIDILPELQRFGMNYYVPLASTGGSKPFMYTAPFIYQAGGSIYDEKSMQVALDQEEAVKGIKLMSDLFSVYGLPQQVPSFYNHFRSATLPIGVSTLADYQRLLVAAPEIAGSWDIALHPGIEDETGDVQRWAAGSAQSAMAFANTEYPEESWEFLKWWTSSETQSDFAFQLQNIYGSSYLWSSANLEAFQQLPIEEDHKALILEQWEYLMEVPKVPGGYIVEREISNIWNKIVFNGENPRASIDASLITMNKELARKLEEFGYMEDDVLMKEYPLPSIETIESWGE